MTERVRRSQISDDAEIAEIAAALRAWDPHLDLAVLRDESRLYEPDGTLYGIALSSESTLTVRHKPRLVRRGDMIVVPRSVSIDADPEVNLLTIRHDGASPLHFRERFIQTWGMDHLPLNRPSPDVPVISVIPVNSARFRISYEVIDIEKAAFVGSTELNLHVLVVLDGHGRLVLGQEGETDIERDLVTLVSTGVSYRLEGSGRIGRLILEPEVIQESRKMGATWQSPSPESPEYELPT